MRPSSVHAELRVVRVVSALLAVGLLGAVIAQPRFVPRPGAVPGAPWLVDVVLWSQAVPIAIGVVAPWVDLPRLRRLHALNVIVTAGVLAFSIGVIAAVHDVGTTDPPWMLSVSGASAISALIAWGDRAAWLTLVGTSAGIIVLRAAADRLPVDMLVNDLQAFAGAAAAVPLVAALIRASRYGDEIAARVITAAGARAADEARRSVQSRIQALVHDEVLAVLLLASRDIASLRPAVAEHAARARRLIGALAEPRSDDAVPADRLATDLVAAVREIAPDAAVDVEDSAVLLPPAAATALLGAAAQALQNSVTHAPAAVRHVRLRASGDVVEVVVGDDGPGFDLTRVPGARMGIRVSILGRMEAVAGGTADVATAPGRGTTVVLRWRPASVAVPDLSTEDLVGQSSMLRNLRLAVVLFLTAQVAAAVAVTTYAEDPWVPVLATIGVTGAVAVLGWRDPGTPSRGRTAIAAALVALTAQLVWVPITGRAMTYADWSYLGAAAFVLAILVIRGRTMVALVLLVPVLVEPVVAARVHGYAANQAGAAVVRTLMLVLVSTLSMALIARLRARTERLVASEMAVRREQDGEVARRAEARERMRELEELTGPVLAELQTGEPLTPAQIGDCVALEGRLRDHYRAGRLARPPLVEAAAAARRRGVDVVLLDDAPDRRLEGAQLGAVLAWMSEVLAETPSGRFTGRILPPERGAVATVVAGDDAIEFPG